MKLVFHKVWHAIEQLIKVALVLMLLWGCHFLFAGYWIVVTEPKAAESCWEITQVPTSAMVNAFYAYRFLIIHSSPFLYRFSTDTNTISSLVARWRIPQSSFRPMPSFWKYRWLEDGVKASETNAIYYRTTNDIIRMWVLTNSGTCYIIREGGS